MASPDSKAVIPIYESRPAVKELVFEILKIEKEMLYEDKHNEIRDRIIRLIKERTR